MAGLAGSALLVQPVLAEEDAVDTAVTSVTEAVKVTCATLAACPPSHVVADNRQQYS